MQSKLKEEKQSKTDKKSRLIIIGSLFLIVCGISILAFKYYQIFKDNKEDENKLDEFFEQQSEIENHEVVEESKEEVIYSYENYMFVLEIPKISLKRGVYSKESTLNNVDKNVQILQESDMPDKVNGNFILAGHSGTGRASYFKNLNKLVLGDEAYIYYNNVKYTYRLVNSYDVEKTGEASINRDLEKTTLTLITCKHNFDIQTIYIFELV